MADEIERRIRNFLWEGYEERGGEHIVAWRDVCKLKKFGALGIGNILKHNKELLMTWLWRFPLERQSLWARVVKSKYGIRTNGWDTKGAARVTYRCPWKFISSVYDHYIKQVVFKVGKDNNIRFWEDVWVGDILLAQRFSVLYRMSNSHNEKLLSLRSLENFISCGSYSWDLRFGRNLNEWELEQISELLVLLDSVRFFDVMEDSRVWLSQESGISACKSALNELTKLEDGELLMSFFHLESCAPSKVKFFGWLLAIGKLNTSDVLQKRKPYMAFSPAWCVLCKQDGESIDRIFLHCPMATRLWS